MEYDVTRMLPDNGERWLHPGFTRDGALNYLFKRSIHRADTSLNATYFQEELVKPYVFLESLATEPIPQDPPDDFVQLSQSEIATLFGIQESEVLEFDTTVEGVSVFSIERSTSYPQILRINNLRMKPLVQNINEAFSAVPSRSKVNLLNSAIPTHYGKAKYKCVIKRTIPGGELSLGGNDYVNLHQVAHIFDTDHGILRFHEPDKESLSPNPVKFLSPPAISCYVYKGNFGRLGWQVKNNAIILAETQLLLGKQTVTNPTLLMDISGTACITNLFVQSLTTKSDIRLKENIAPAPPSPSILDLQPVHYNYKTNPGVQEFGLIAQEVQKVAPEIVKETGGMLSVQYDRLGVYLLPIVKAQQERIEKLEAQLAALVKALA